MDRITTLEQWLDGKPGDRFALYSLALELKKAGRTTEAGARFRELLAAHPTAGAGHLQYGRLLAELGQEDAARAAWEAGLDALRGLDDPEARRSFREIEGELDGM